MKIGTNPFTPTRNPTSERNALVKTILTESEKYSDDMALVKERFDYIEAQGAAMVMAKEDRVKRLYDHAFGRINMRDFIDTDAAFGSVTGKDIPDLDTLNLKYYGIIPVIFKAVLAARDEMYVKYGAQAVNPEATSDILQKLDRELKAAIVRNVETMFMQAAEGMEPDQAQQALQMALESKEVQKALTHTYRTTVEMWAVNHMNVEDQMFDMRSVETQVLKQLVVSGDPAVHIDYKDGRYMVEVLDESNIFYSKSDSADDHSEAEFFGWFKYMTLTEILNAFPNMVESDDVESLAENGRGVLGSNFHVNYTGEYAHKAQILAEARHNMKVLRSLAGKYGINGGPNDFNDQWRVSTIYFYIPRKVGVLTTIVDGRRITDLVDENFKVTLKPVYRKGYQKTADNLISGEHVKWTYYPELWRGVKINTVPGRVDSTPILVSKKDEIGKELREGNIFIELGKCDIQHNDPRFRYSVRIPVHGGTAAHSYGFVDSFIEPAIAWQVDYNWVLNRKTQLLQSDLGKFFMLPEALIPQDSLDNDWAAGSDKLVDFATTARDVGIAPTANPSIQAGGGVIGQQGYGQVVDLGRTQEVASLMNVASMLARECFASVGMTPEFVYGSIAPTQSAASAGLGQQRVVAQLRTLFARLEVIMSRVRTTMLQTAKHIAAESPTVQMSYFLTEGQRQVFTASTDDFHINDLAVYVTSNAADTSVIEAIKRYVASNNTMGADSLELSYLLSFKTLPELFQKLREVRVDKQKQAELDHQRALEIEKQRTDTILQKDREKYKFDRDENALDRERDIAKAQISALGYANDTAEGIQKAIMDLKQADSQQRAMYDRMAIESRMAAMQGEKMKEEVDNKRLTTALKEKVELKKLEQRDRELQLRELDIKSRNMRTKALD
jgi:hypothetical protein